MISWDRTLTSRNTYQLFQTLENQKQKSPQYELFNTIVYRKFQEISLSLEDHRPEHSVQDLQVGRLGPEH